MIIVGWVDAPKSLPTTSHEPVGVQAPVVRTGPLTLPRTLAVVAEPWPEATTVSGPVAYREHGPVMIVLEALPGRVGPGGSTEFLVMIANAGPWPLSGVQVGLVLPPGVEVSSVTPPSGTLALTGRSGAAGVVRARLPRLNPGACVGLEVAIQLPDDPPPDLSGPYRVIAFVTPGRSADVSLTCEHLLEVAATG